MPTTAAIQADLKKVKPPLATALTLPPPCYSDPDWLTLETQRLFTTGWVGVGREDRWQHPGDFHTIDLPNAPLVIWRDQLGTLRAWANTCRHRGMKLLTGSGNRKRVICPFHAWSYDLNGALCAAPRMETATDFAPADFGLTEFRLGCQDGFVFVCLDPQTPPLADWLGDFSQTHAAWSLTDWRGTRVREFTVDCNWKLFLEVFNEYYHLPHVHPDSIAATYLEPQPCDPVSGKYTTQFGDTVGSGGLFAGSQPNALPPAASLPPDGPERRGTRYTWVYPNLTFAACFDSLWMYQAYPLTAASCRVVQTICFPPPGADHDDFTTRAEAYYARVDDALAEDLPFLQAQQTGVTSDFAKQGRFSALEPSVGNFACWYATRMSEEST